MLEAYSSGNSIFNQSRDEFLDEVRVVCVHIMVKCVGMYPSIVPVLVSIKMIPPDLDEIHYGGNVDVLEKDHDRLSTCSFCNAPGDLMDLLLRDGAVDLSEMVLAHGDELEQPGVPAPARMITQDLRN